MADIAHLVLKEHEYDPNGDTILVLQEWHEAVPDTDTMETDEPRGILATDGEIYSDCYVRVHSNVLSAVSAVFETMLTAYFGEAVLLRSIGGLLLRLPEDNLDAMLILLNLIYGRPIPDPVEFDAETISEIALLVDKYDIRRRLMPIADFWFLWMKQYLINDFDMSRTRTRHDFWDMDHQKQTFWRIAMSWVLQRPEEFKISTQIAIWNCQQGMDHIGHAEEEPWISFLHSAVLDEIFASRRKAVSGIMPLIKRYQENFQSSMPSWRREAVLRRHSVQYCEDNGCELLLLGALTRTLTATTELSFGHWSFGQMRAHVLKHSSTDYRKNADFCERHLRLGQGKCENRIVIDNLVKDLDNLVQGLELGSIRIPDPRTGKLWRALGKD